MPNLQQNRRNALDKIPEMFVNCNKVRTKWHFSFTKSNFFHFYPNDLVFTKTTIPLKGYSARYIPRRFASWSTTTTVLVYSTTTSPSGDSCILFTSEGRQARVSYEQNGFRVVWNRNTKRRNFRNKRGSCSLQHEEGDKIRFGSFWQFTAC